MKSFITILAVSVLLCACSQRDDNKQQVDAGRKFNKAFEELAKAESGTRQEKRDADSPPIEEYRQAKLQAAANELKPLTSTGRGAQQLAARNLIAETSASKARLLARDAVLAWTDQTPLASELISDASSIRMARVIATENGKVDMTAYLADLRKQEQDLVAQQESLNGQVAELQKSVEDMRAQAQDLNDKRMKKAAEADELSRKAFKAEGQMQYDLYVQAAGATREADKLTADADLITAKLSVDHAKLRVAQKQVEHSGILLGEVRDAIKQAQQRGTDVAKLASDSQERAENLTKKFDEQFKSFVSTQADKIDAVFAESMKNYDDAVNGLTTASGVAPQASKSLADLELAGLRAEMGQVLHQQSVIDATYLDLLKSLGESVSSTLPDRATALTEAQTAAEARANKAKDAAKDALVTAAETLQKLTEASDKEVQRTALGQLIQVNLSLGSVTGNTEYNDSATKLRSQLHQLD
ncbi:MAG: hypothetical protein GC162_17500 [Planctomycetes bacterium]|nr:hypothetical protein [Planctomycetota bacterium]